MLVFLRQRLQPPGGNPKRYIAYLLFVLFFLLGLYLRTSGLFRGLGEQANIFHPDEPKQILALFNFLNGDYIRYYGSLFYDGYPYGLNHLDEYILRPIIYFFTPSTPDYQTIYIYARLLRLLYGLVIMLIGYRIVLKLTNSSAAALLALLLTAIAPLSVTVNHFASGDIGVDLFTALCCMFLLSYIDKRQKNRWALWAGFTIGAAFSAKYNGLLLAMVPLTIMALEFLQTRQLRMLLKQCTNLTMGFFIGLFIFTPALLLDFKTTVANMAANFKFIKNYNVPPQILAKPWLETFFLGIRHNGLHIVATLGSIAFLACLMQLMLTGGSFIGPNRPAKERSRAERIYIFSLALFPCLALVIALGGKYVVQPFHFSYLELPIIVTACLLVARLFTATTFFFRGCGLCLALFLVINFAGTSWKENFFWRHEDNSYHAQKLPQSLYDKEAFYVKRSGVIRSLFLEPAGNAVFRNHNIEAKGPDAHFWQNMGVAPLPQVANPIGENWIFLNGPTFPRNDKTIVIHGENHGKTGKRYLVLPMDKKITGLGLRSGSFACEASIRLGGERATIKLEAHQQKILSITAKKWRISGEGKKRVRIIPITVTVPHNSLWITILTSQKEKNLFTIFGGGQGGRTTPPAPLPALLQNSYYDAIASIRYLESKPSWRVIAGKKIPMWEIAVPAGRYTLLCEVDGLDEQVEIAICLEDAKGGLYGNREQIFRLKKGIQRIRYSFTKPFTPYQTKVIITGKTGRCQMEKFILTPDYRRLSDDFRHWRNSGVQPTWLRRFNK